MESVETEERFGKDKVTINDIGEYVENCIITGYEYDDYFREFTKEELSRIIILITNQEFGLEDYVKESIEEIAVDILNE